MRTVGRCRSLFTIAAVTDSRARGARRAGRACARAQLRRADLLRAGAQRRDRRHDVERRLPLAEPLRLLGDDRLGALRLAPAAGERLGDDGLEVVDVVEVAAVELVDGGVEVARDGEVDQEERPAAARARAPARPSSRSRIQPGALVEERTTSARAQLAPRAGRAGAAPRRSARRAPRRDRACGSRRTRSSAPRETRLRAASSPTLPAPTRRIAPAGEVAEHLLRERRGGRRDRRRALADRRLRARLPARMERLAEEAVEERPRSRPPRTPRAPGRGSRPRRARASRAPPRRGRGAARRPGRAAGRARPELRLERQRAPRSAFALGLVGRSSAR